jgi:hypothetical protein
LTLDEPLSVLYKRSRTGPFLGRGLPEMMIRTVKLPVFKIAL